MEDGWREKRKAHLFSQLGVTMGQVGSSMSSTRFLWVGKYRSHN